MQNDEQNFREDEANGETDVPRMSKDEMRAKIRASLAAQEEKEYGTTSTEQPVESSQETPKQQRPSSYTSYTSTVYTGSSNQRRTGTRQNNSSIDRAKAEKARQLRENMAAANANEAQAENADGQNGNASKYGQNYGQNYTQNGQNLDRSAYTSSQYQGQHAYTQNQYAQNNNGQYGYTQNGNSQNANRGATQAQYAQRNNGQNGSHGQTYGQNQNQNRNHAQKPQRYTEDDMYYGQKSKAKAKSPYTKWIPLIILIVLVVLVIACYIGGLIYYNDKFLPNTYVNDVNLSGMTEEEAETAIVDSAELMGVTFITNTGEEIVFKGSTFGCEVSVPEGALDDAFSESHATWFTKIFSETEYTITLDQTYSEDALVSLIAAYDWGDTAPTDAQIVQNDDGTFSIQAEDNGNMVDTDILSTYTLEQLASGVTTINMALSDCYLTADVTSEDLEDTLSLYEKYADVVITFDMTNREELFDPVGTVELTFDTYMNWITFDEDGNLSLDKDQAMEWIETNIADPYDTFCEDGYTREFESTMDGTVTVTLTETSTYGWLTDVEATADALEEYLQAGESITTEPEWTQSGFRPTRSDGTVFEEGTYIEIDISEQHLWFYVNGELYIDTDVVTGLASDPDRVTNTGIFKIRDKIENTTLGTYEVQGYETDVNYWMPIDHTGIGLHDLERDEYGGDVYLTNGSHGCINLPLDAAAAIFEEAVIGLPVIIID